MSLSVPAEEFTNVARPGANDARTPLEKNPTMQSTDVEHWKLGMKTSSARGSVGSMYSGLTLGRCLSAVCVESCWRILLSVVTSAQPNNNPSSLSLAPASAIIHELQSNLCEVTWQ